MKGHRCLLKFNGYYAHIDSCLSCAVIAWVHSIAPPALMNISVELNCSDASLPWKIVWQVITYISGYMHDELL